MATQIVIANAVGDKITCAFYFPIAAPDQVAAANDQTRTEAYNSGLTAQELQDLKDGVLYEVVRVLTKPSEKTKAQFAADLVAYYTKLAPIALQEYKDKYDIKAQYIGYKYDSAGGWS